LLPALLPGPALRHSKGDDRRIDGSRNSNNLLRENPLAIKVLTVCTGNICRSPSAEVILRDKLAAAGLAGAVEVDSAGLAGYHIGQPPSEPAIRLAAGRGYDLTPLRARRVAASDFTGFDLLLAMDSGHLRQLKRLQPQGATCRLNLFLDGLPQLGIDVADPFYGGDSEYLAMLDIIEAAVPAWVARLQEDFLTRA